jgi:hypothetical protein
MTETIDKWRLANEIYRAMKVQRDIKIYDEYLPRFIEHVISYHMQENKIPRKDCIWGCAELDENDPVGWYDGMLCPTCGYVRGMNKPEVG